MLFPLLVTFDPGVSPPRSKIEKLITRSTLVSPVRQTCPTIADRVCCENIPPHGRWRPVL